MPQHSLALALLAPGVRAGNQLWGSSVELQSPHPVEYLTLDAAGFAARDNATRVMAKRYFAMNPTKAWANPSSGQTRPSATAPRLRREASDRLGEYLFSWLLPPELLVAGYLRIVTRDAGNGFDATWSVTSNQESHSVRRPHKSDRY